MKTKISLKELNSNGKLILSFKKAGFISKGEPHVFLCYDKDSTTCYVHSYKGAYYFTQHIISTIQFEFKTFFVAKSMFIDFISSVL